jgi:membrane peptidoglycan carboxypeptidase
MPSRISKQHSHKDNEQTSNSDVKLSDSNNQLIVIPSYEDDLENLVSSSDSHIVQKHATPLKPGSKNFHELSSVKSTDTSPSLIGKKGKANWGLDINLLKNKFGFSWKKMGRNAGLFLIIILVFGVIISSAVAAWAIDIYNNSKPLNTQQLESSIVYAKDGKTELFKFFDQGKREVVSLCPIKDGVEDISQSCIPKVMQLAIIALEDERFNYNPDGIPWSNIGGALVDCAKIILTQSKEDCRGGSGLYQQTVKNFTGNDAKTPQRKVEELISAVKLNQVVNKSQVLELYLNQVAFSRNAFGVQEASLSYFGKGVNTVSPVEACFLAALVQQPSVYNSSINKPESDAWNTYENRKDTCLQKLRQNKLEGDNIEPFIKTDEEYNALLKVESVVATSKDQVAELSKGGKVVFIPNRIDVLYPHFKDYITQELRKFNISEQALYTRGYKIVTTLDPEIQNKAQQIVSENYQAYVVDSGANNISTVVLDGPTGGILAMIGSIDYNNEAIDGQVNIATSPQQPGSSYKPYVYATDFEKDFNPGTILLDSRTDFGGGYVPRNFSGTFSGPVTIRYALQNSLNIPAVKGAYLAAGQGNVPNGTQGINEVFTLTDKIGVKYPCQPNADGAKCDDLALASQAYRDRCGLSSALGGCEVSLLSHTAGMNTFAQDGNLRTARPFINIIDTKTNVDLCLKKCDDIYPRTDKVIDPLIARQVCDVMSDYGARDPGVWGSFRRNLEVDGWRIAAKTGTSNDVRDTWTVGFSPYYSMSMWVGNTDNTPMKNTASASNSNSFIWKKLMTAIHEGKEKKQCSRDGLQAVKIDPKTGFLSEGGNTEYLTPNQLKALQDASSRVNNPEYNPKAQNIFQNRSAVILRKVKIDRVNGKLAVEGKTLPENTEEKTCAQPISEFPLQSNWAAAAESISGNDKYCALPTDVSDLDQVAEQNSKPLITTNLTSSSNAPNTITASTVPTGTAGKGILALRLRIDGVQVVDSAVNSFSFDATAVAAGVKNVEVEAVDSFGIKSISTFTNVTFGVITTTPLTAADLASIAPNCGGLDLAANSTVSCSFSLPITKSLPASLRFKIGSGSFSGSCSLSGTLVTCSSVNTGNSNPSTVIQGQIGGSTSPTLTTVKLT